jgi:methylphosphotriester-DNA--protein-cysteine methyltransferase
MGPRIAGTALDMPSRGDLRSGSIKLLRGRHDKRMLRSRGQPRAGGVVHAVSIAEYSRATIYRASKPTPKVTPNHLRRSCHAATGQSALDLLHERLFLEARRLLAYTAAPVAEVARDPKFDDASYFSCFFTRHAGRSPQAFRGAVQTGQVVGPWTAARLVTLRLALELTN